MEDRSSWPRALDLRVPYPFPVPQHGPLSMISEGLLWGILGVVVTLLTTGAVWVYAQKVRWDTIYRDRGRRVVDEAIDDKAHILIYIHGPREIQKDANLFVRYAQLVEHRARLRGLMDGAIENGLVRLHRAVARYDSEIMRAGDEWWKRAYWSNKFPPGAWLLQAERTILRVLEDSREFLSQRPVKEVYEWESDDLRMRPLYAPALHLFGKARRLPINQWGHGKIRGEKPDADSTSK